MKSGFQPYDNHKKKSWIDSSQPSTVKPNIHYLISAILRKNIMKYMQLFKSLLRLLRYYFSVKEFMHFTENYCTNILKKIYHYLSFISNIVILSICKR